MAVRYLIADPHDRALFDHVADEVFDRPIAPGHLDEFLADSRHHVALAVDAGWIVGFASAVHYLHPDKPPELWINELGVASSHRRRGIAGALMECMFSHGRSLGFAEAWVLSEDGDEAAHAFYRSLAHGADAAPSGAVMHSFSLVRD